MSEWEDISITGRNKERSKQPLNEDAKLSRQVFTLSDIPPQRWMEICNAALLAEPGRLGRVAEVRGQSLYVWGGPNIFDERDANHLKKLVAYANEKYREALEPVDFGGLDAFGG
ncbi:MAG: hypothetical protein OXG39_11005 [Chloroflexi bacterium]|nr:hypothetical protein [Chloroflexota bacterium]